MEDILCALWLARGEEECLIPAAQYNLDVVEPADRPPLLIRPATYPTTSSLPLRTAGYETTANLLSYTIYLLALHPGAGQKGCIPTASPAPPQQLCRAT